VGTTLVLPKKEWYWTAAMIQKLRGKRSLAEFADALGVPKKTVSLWVANRGPAFDNAKLSALARKEAFHSGWKLKGSVTLLRDVEPGHALMNRLVRESIERTAQQL
jgi:hypothetical protein